MLNEVTLMGRLTRDPVTSYMQNSNSSVTRFTLAVEKDFKAANEEKPKTNFISCEAWNQKGDFITKYFRQGSMICVKGSIETGSYTDRNGNKVYTTVVAVDKSYFTGEKLSVEEAAQPAPEDEGFMNIPDGIEDELPFN